jgi:hypothetical protein
MLIKTENTNLYRDINSKAIIVSDSKAREEYKKRIREKQEIQELRNDVDVMKECVSEITTIKEEISEIKQLILSLTNKVT